MTTTAATWFYRTPENIPYLLSERVNSTFWEARLGGVWLNVVRAESPFKMEGAYNGAEISLDWEPNKWLRLSTKPAAPGLTMGLANILRRQPDLSYETPDGRTVWEWWMAGADKRWQEIQGKPAFHNPARLNLKN